MHTLRLATLRDQNEIRDIIDRSCRVLGGSDYTDAQIEGALGTAWGLDTQLIEDETYFVSLHRDDIVACGGWSFRETLFGADQNLNRDAAIINPTDGSARIRAFFVRPEFARRGIGSNILRHCEEQAGERGYRRFSLMATLPGKRLYERHNYVADQPVDYPLNNGLEIRFVPMHKEAPGVSQAFE